MGDALGYGWCGVLTPAPALTEPARTPAWQPKRPRATRHGTISLRIMGSSYPVMVQAVGHTRFADGRSDTRRRIGTCACRSLFLLGTILGDTHAWRAPVHIAPRTGVRASTSAQ